MFKEFILPQPILLDRNWTNIDGTMIYSVKVQNVAAIDSYYFKDQESINDILKEFFKFNIPPDYLGHLELDLSTGDVHPHTDNHRFALNIILEDQGAVTKFWTTSKKIETSWDGSKNYNIHDCEFIDEFKATAGSAWLYDLHVIHSVHNLASTGSRKILTVRWYEKNITFDQMYDSIEVL